MSLVLEFAGAATWLTVVALTAMLLRARIRRPGSDHWTRRVSGSAFIAFAISLAWR